MALLAVNCLLFSAHLTNQIFKNSHLNLISKAILLHWVKLLKFICILHKPSFINKQLNFLVLETFKEKKVPRWCWHHFGCLREDKIGSLKAAGKILQWITNIPCVYMIGTAVSIGHWLYIVEHRMDSENILLLESVHVDMQYSNSLFYNHCYLLPDPRDAFLLKTTIKPSKHYRNPPCKYIHILVEQGFIFRKKDTVIENFLNHFPSGGCRVV